MDGTGRETLHNTSLTWPNDVAIDYDTQTLYWVDAKLRKIETSSVNGSGRRLLTEESIFSPFSITFHDGILYWSDWSLNQVIYTSVLDPGQVNGLVDSLSTDPMGVVVVSIDTQPIGKQDESEKGVGHYSLIASLDNIQGSKDQSRWELYQWRNQW